MKNWWIYKGTREPDEHDDIEKRLPKPPNWRTFRRSNEEEHGQDDTHQHAGQVARGETYQASEEEVDLVNAALYLRRPLFITGKSGVGKTSLAYAVAYELKLGPVLSWPITTRATLKDGLYYYDAIGRLQDASLQGKDTDTVPDIGQYLRLGPLGTALLPSRKPRVLLIDEIDKSDIDLPNDLLNIFEEGEFVIPELARVSKQFEEVKVMPYDGVSDNDRVPLKAGRVLCDAFPFIVLTSNGEREFPPAFLRRCLRLDVRYPDEKRLTEIIKAHLGQEVLLQAEQLIKDFIERQKNGDLATDQLLNAIYLTTRANITLGDKETLRNVLLKYLSSAEVV